MATWTLTKGHIFPFGFDDLLPSPNLTFCRYRVSRRLDPPAQRRGAPALPMPSLAVRRQEAAVGWNWCFPHQFMAMVTWKPRLSEMVWVAGGHPGVAAGPLASSHVWLLKSSLFSSHFGIIFPLQPSALLGHTDGGKGPREQQSLWCVPQVQREEKVEHGAHGMLLQFL